MSKFALPIEPDDSSAIARIKRKMAEAHLTVAEGDGYLAALIVLQRIVMGVDDKGVPLSNLSHRDKIQAAKAILKSQAETVESEKDAPQQQPAFNITIGVPEILRAVEEAKARENQT